MAEEELSGGYRPTWEAFRDVALVQCRGRISFRRTRFLSSGKLATGTLGLPGRRRLRTFLQCIFSRVSESDLT